MVTYTTGHPMPSRQVCRAPSGVVIGACSGYTRAARERESGRCLLTQYRRVCRLSSTLHGERVWPTGAYYGGTLRHSGHHRFIPAGATRGTFVRQRRLFVWPASDNGQCIDVQPLAVHVYRGCRIVWADECCFGGRQTRSCGEHTLPTIEHETHGKYSRLYDYTGRKMRAIWQRKRIHLLTANLFGNTSLHKSLL